MKVKRLKNRDREMDSKSRNEPNNTESQNKQVSSM